MSNKVWFSLAVCACLAVLTIWAQKAHWLDGENFLLLSVLGALHLVTTAVVLWFIPSGVWFKVAFVVLLIVGQLWGIEFIAMLVIWKLRGFAP